MGLFSKLTEKKECGVCGKELGLLGKSRVEDGYICKECESGLSPFFSRRRHTTVDGIKEQLARREENKALVAAFVPTREYGGGRWRVLVDDNARCIVVTDEPDWRGANADVIPFESVMGADVRIDQERHELTYQDGEGAERRYEPPRYEESYDFWISVRVGIPYIDRVEFKLNDWGIENRWSPDYDRCEHMAGQLRDVLRGLSAGSASPPGPPAQQRDRPQHRQQGQPQVQPPQGAPAFCPNCGAPASGARFCESCGSPLAA